MNKDMVSYKVSFSRLHNAHTHMYDTQAILFFHLFTIHQIVISFSFTGSQLPSVEFSTLSFEDSFYVAWCLVSEVVWCLECGFVVAGGVAEAGGGVVQVWSLGGRGAQCLQSAAWRQSLVTTTPWAGQHARTSHTHMQYLPCYSIWLSNIKLNIILHSK